jgi:hypothetical protein
MKRFKVESATWDTKRNQERNKIKHGPIAIWRVSKKVASMTNLQMQKVSHSTVPLHPTYVSLGPQNGTVQKKERHILF